jgi:scyllo-inosamine 4-kinase
MKQLYTIAGQIFNRYSIDFSTAIRGGGWSNATWLASGWVLRLAVEPGTNRLRREAGLGALLPPAVGFPVSLATGVTDGFEWSLSREIQGENLGELWPSLDWDHRIDAMRQLWQKIEAVHTVSPAAAAPYVLDQSPFYLPDAAGAKARLNRVFERGFIATSQVSVAEAILDLFWQAYDQAPKVLNHGDFTTENALYHAGRVVSLLDFEFALVAPA